MPNITEITELAKRKLVYAGVNTEGRLTIAGNAEQIVGFAVQLADDHCQETGTVIGFKHNPAPDADRLPVVAHETYHPGGDQPGTHVLNFGQGPLRSQGLVRLSDVRALIHDLSVVKQRQDEILQTLAVTVGLPPRSDWLLIREKVLELKSRPTLDFKGKSVLDNGNVELSFTMTPATVEAFQVQWPADAPVAQSIDWKG